MCGGPNRENRWNPDRKRQWKNLIGQEKGERSVRDNQRKGGQIQEKRGGKPPVEPELKTKGQKGEVPQKAPALGTKVHR